MCSPSFHVNLTNGMGLLLLLALALRFKSEQIQRWGREVPHILLSSYPSVGA